MEQMMWEFFKKLILGLELVVLKRCSVIDLLSNKIGVSPVVVVSPHRSSSLSPLADRICCFNLYPFSFLSICSLSPSSVSQFYWQISTICWLWQKVGSEEDKGFQKFLDNVQYKCNGILRYERIFGQGYVSTGGFETTKEFVAKLDLKPGQKVLDVCCGIGGGDFYMAEKFDVDVVGIDLSVNMISFALERAIGLKCSVEFEVADCTKKTYPDSSFDVIYSRDTILHIQDKPALFKSFHKWLKPGGKVLISDYCKGPGTPSETFAEYIKQRGYDLHDVESYGQMLKDAGFSKVTAEDRTEQFLKVLQKELDTVEKAKNEFIQDFSEEDYNDIVGGWKSKLVRSSSGEQRWGLFVAHKQ